eukprot:CAMPEP_0167755648 /NCGR_PEP_ID=MMETSP0110_2-20121227/8946_1 /TAXON_ID=629695 /ORGANISM="Gymnochlora sp., Strain CCMP2014" /LENGTH=197 /DNA_ID=CAMNT_0007641669 /DNA_START=52 /DNA_END=645 /DNA_ORIENTATION=-
MASRGDYVVRLLMLGDSGAGKSTLLLRYVKDEYESEHMPTIGIDFRLKTINLDGKVIKVRIWDTAGQERFRTITTNYYRGAHGILLLYDITKMDSFKNVRKWIGDVRTYAEQNVNLVLLGNKCDLHNQRQVQYKQGEDLAKEYKIKFFETSAKDNVNVNEAFTSLALVVCDRLHDLKKNKKEQLTLEGKKGKSGCCK